MKIEDAIKRLQAAKTDVELETALDEFFLDEDVQLLKFAENDYRRHAPSRQIRRGTKASKQTVIAQLTSALVKERERIKAMSPVQAIYSRCNQANSTIFEKVTR